MTEDSFVSWAGLGHALVDVANHTSLDTTGALSRLSRLIDGISSPLRWLERLDNLGARAEQGDLHAETEFIGLLQSAASATKTVERRRQDGTNASMPCSWHCCTDLSDVRPAVVVGTTPDQKDNHLITQQSIVELLVTVGNIAVRAGLDVEASLDTIVALGSDAAMAFNLVAGHRSGGAGGAILALMDAQQAGRLNWLYETFPAEAPVMRTMSGALPAMPDLPSLPGNIDGIGGLQGLRGVPDIPIDELIAGLLGRVRKPKRWDPDDWCPVYPWMRFTPNFIDPTTNRWITCVVESRRILSLLAEPPPPAPSPSVWTTGITSVVLGGRCRGDTVTIKGLGFGATQPPNTALLLPTINGCRPVNPNSWSDSEIRAQLPANVASGAVGFGDVAYIATYDAWAARMADLERQLSLLLCAPLNRPLVRPFHQCPPASPIVSITAGVAVIDSFTINGETTHVHESGSPITVSWTVRNCTSITISRTSLQGPLFGGSTSLVTSNLVGNHAFGLVNHTGPDVWQYTLTTIGACGVSVSRTVVVITTRPPNLRVLGMQVTQSIQTATHSVEMVANKPTVVRVLIAHGLAGWGGDIVPNVTGRIRMHRNGVWTAWIDPAAAVAPMVATPGTSISVVASPSFNATNQTLNFMLPIGWCSGEATYQVEVRVAGFGAIGGYAGQSQTISRNCPRITFASRRALQFRYIRVNWNGAGAPTHATCVNTLLGAVPLLPTPMAGVAALPGRGIENRTSGMSIDAIAAERRNMLDDFDDEHNCSAWEAFWEWLGVDCPDEDGSIWVLIPGNFQRGEAYAISSNVCYTPPSDGPYAAHEISHCLNQEHVRLAPAGSAAPTGGDAASAWPNNAMQLDVPFDTSGTPGATLPRALTLAGRGVADVMTYWGTQQNTWPLPARWSRLWNEIGP